MGGLFGQTYPDLVLLGAFDAHQGKIGDGKEQDEYRQLDIGEVGEASQQCRVLVEEVLALVLVNDDVDFVLAVLEVVELLVEVSQIGRRNLKREAVLGLGQAEVAVQQDVVLVIDEQHGDVVVRLDDAQQEIHVGAAAGTLVARLVHFIGAAALAAHRDEFLGGVGPYLHTFALLFGQVLDQVVGDVKEERDEHHRKNQENHFPDAS